MATDIRDLDARAVRASVEVVSRAGAGDLDRPTPCSGWTLGDLLAHMTAQHRGFAAASAGRGSDPGVWDVTPAGDDAVAAYVRAAGDVVAAFAADGVMERQFVLPEIDADAGFSAAQAIGFHFIDYVVHAWDVARSLNIGFELDPGLAEPALRLALMVPGGDRRLEPGAAFRPSLPAPSDATPLDRIVSALGRSPNWPR